MPANLSQCMFLKDLANSVGTALEPLLLVPGDKISSATPAIKHLEQAVGLCIEYVEMSNKSFFARFKSAFFANGHSERLAELTANIKICKLEVNTAVPLATHCEVVLHLPNQLENVSTIVKAIRDDMAQVRILLHQQPSSFYSKDDKELTGYASTVPKLQQGG